MLSRRSGQHGYGHAESIDAWKRKRVAEATLIGNSLKRYSTCTFSACQPFGPLTTLNCTG